jgi:hypothetical protein
MTARAGHFNTGLINQGPGRGKKGARIGGVRTLSFVIGSGVPVWKNKAWIAAASAYENWVSSPDPSVSPPSGLTGTFFQHVQLVT